MKTPYLVPRKSGRKKYYHFRSFIPKDLIQKFHGRKEFQISLKNVTNEKKLMISIYLKTSTEQMFLDIRNGKNITINGALGNNLKNLDAWDIPYFSEKLRKMKKVGKRQFEN